MEPIEEEHLDITNLDRTNMPIRRIKVLVVDDHAVLRSAISQILTSQPEVELVVTATDYAEAEELVAKLYPEIIWLDLHVAHPDSIAEIGRLRKLSPDSRIMVLADVENEQEAVEAIMVGVQGYRSKEDVELDEIMSMIQRLSYDEFVLRPELLARLMQRLRAAALAPGGSEKRSGHHPFLCTDASSWLAQLTVREREILQLLAAAWIAKPGKTG